MKSVHVDLLGAETRYYETENYRTRVIEYGKGTPLILMHGGGGHAEAFSRNIVRLGQECRAMAIDFCWHGLSSAPAFRSGNWLAQLTDQVLELLDHIGAEKAILEGESLGGWVCMDMGINHPGRVDKLILNTCWGMKQPGQYAADEDSKALRETSINALNNPAPDLIRRRLEWLMPLGGVTDELVDIRRALWSGEQTRRALTEYYERLFSQETGNLLFDDAALSKINAPSLLLWTEKNPGADVDEAKRLQGLIEGSQLHVIQGAAHWPQWECPDEHDQVVSQFISQ